MANPEGSFIWYELMTTDPDGAKSFYDKVIGWNIASQSDAKAGDMDYRHIARSDGGSAGGVLALTKPMLDGGARPGWFCYFYVKDVDAAAAAITGDGGKVMMPPTSLPGVGRMAMLTDPQGVLFYIMTPEPPPGREDMSSDVYDRHAAQRVSWNELASPDLEGAKAFYSKHFNFEFNDSMPMGPMGDYCFIDHGALKGIGAIMQQQDKSHPAMWLFYFRVPSIAAAKATIEANGGQVLWGPAEVPGGEWVISGTDPQGAGFGLVGAKGD
jgi:predicted enzyme related to lactoylglutathione lyase